MDGDTTTGWATTATAPAATSLTPQKAFRSAWRTQSLRAHVARAGGRGQTTPRLRAGVPRRAAAPRTPRPPKAPRRGPSDASPAEGGGAKGGGAKGGGKGGGQWGGASCPGEWLSTAAAQAEAQRLLKQLAAVGCTVKGPAGDAGDLAWLSTAEFNLPSPFTPLDPSKELSAKEVAVRLSKQMRAWAHIQKKAEQKA